jgi:hypothetical protein
MPFNLQLQSKDLIWHFGSILKLRCLGLGVGLLNHQRQAVSKKPGAVAITTSSGAEDLGSILARVREN